MSDIGRLSRRDFKDKTAKEYIEFLIAQSKLLIQPEEQYLQFINTIEHLIRSRDSYRSALNADLPDCYISEIEHREEKELKKLLGFE